MGASQSQLESTNGHNTNGAVKNGHSQDTVNGNGQHNGSHQEQMQQSSSSAEGVGHPPCDCFFFGNTLSSKLRAVAGKTSAIDDSIGSPLPDTPIMQRRFRGQPMLSDQQQAVFSSQYFGLEKEVITSSTSDGCQSLIDSLNIQIQNENDEEEANQQSLLLGRTPTTATESSRSSTVVAPTSVPQIVDNIAQIHEGPDAETYLHEKYILQEVMGVGSTSTVHRCRCRTTGEEYACKVIDFSLIDDRFQGMMAQFRVEIETLMQLQHPGIIRLYDVFIVSPDDKIFIVMELMEGGELFDYVVQKGTLTEEEASRIVQKVTSALVFMHSKNIMHRDLKPENLLLKEKAPAMSSNVKSSLRGSNNDLDVKIIDFGLSKALKEEQPVAQTFLGTRGYLAPEMLQRLDYTRAVDTWALGVIVFVLLCGCLPFDDDTSAVPSDDVVKAKFVLRFPRWAKNLSPSAKDLLSHLLDVNPRTRYTAEQALDHPWVRGVTARRDSLLQSPGRIKKSPLLISSIKSQTRKVPGSVSSKNPTPVMSKTAARRYGAEASTPDSHDSTTPTTPSTMYAKMISPANAGGTRQTYTVVRQASL